MVPLLLAVKASVSWGSPIDSKTFSLGDPQQLPNKLYWEHILSQAQCLALKAQTSRHSPCHEELTVEMGHWIVKWHNNDNTLWEVLQLSVMTTNKRSASSAWRHQPVLHRGGDIRPGVDRCSLIRKQGIIFSILRTAFFLNFFQREQVSFGEGCTAQRAEAWIVLLSIFCCLASDSTFYGQPLPMTLKNLPLVFAAFPTSALLGKEWIANLGAASRMEQEKQKNTLHGESFWC